MPKRYHSIDALRGFCLVNIFVNHVSLGSLHYLSPSRLSFFDSADVFVLLSGISTFLAYGPLSDQRLGKILRRTLVIFSFNALMIAASLAIALIGDMMHMPSNPEASPWAIIQNHGAVRYMAHLFSMQQSIGFSMVLKLYVLLMLVSPVYIWLALQRFWLPLIPAGAVWLLAGHFALVEIDTLTGTPLSMTFLPWNLIFAAGISFGAALRQGLKAPKSSFLIIASSSLLVFCSFVLIVGGRYFPEVHVWLDQRNDAFWSGASKTLQSPVRVASLFAATYLVAVCTDAPLIRLLHAVRADNVLCRLGRQSLQVFSLGAVLAFLIDHYIWYLYQEQNIALYGVRYLAVELLLIVTGILAMITLADRLQIRRAPRTAGQTT